MDKGGGSAKLWLQPVALARNVGYPARELTTILGLVRYHQSEFLEAWHEFFGAG